MPEEVILSHKIIIVASHLDPTSERIVKYLSEEHNLDINVVFFSCFIDNDGKPLIGSSWLMEPEAVEECKISPFLPQSPQYSLYLFCVFGLFGNDVF